MLSGAYMPTLFFNMVLGCIIYTLTDYPDFCTNAKPFDPTKGGQSKPNTWARYEPTPSLPIRVLAEPGQCQFHADTFTPVPLLAMVAVSPTSFVLRFGLPDPTRALNLSTCSCLLVGVSMKKNTSTGNEESPDDEKEEMVIRPYTPISTNVKVGFFDLLIKKYDQGRMSSYLTSLQPSPNTFVSFKHIPMNVKIQYPFGRPKFICFIAGGSGITPIIQALHALLDPSVEQPSSEGTSSDSSRKTEKVVLLYGSRTKDDILADELLNAWAELSRNDPKALKCDFSIVHVLSNESDAVDSKDNHLGVQYRKGFINREMIESSFPGPEEDVLILVCGPPPMYQAICGPRDQKDVSGILGNMGYQSHQVYKF